MVYRNKQKLKIKLSYRDSVFFNNCICIKQQPLEQIPTAVFYLSVFMHCLKVSIMYHASSSDSVVFIGRVSWFLCIL